jgi:hypothetical protein
MFASANYELKTQDAMDAMDALDMIIASLMADQGAPLSRFTLGPLHSSLWLSHVS